MAGLPERGAGAKTAGLMCAALRQIITRLGGMTALGALLLPLMACNNFFQCENKAACPATTTGGGTSTTTVDFAYVAFTTVSGSTSTSYIVGYDISSGALTSVANVTLPFVPVALAVSPNNAFLYVASVPGATSPGIYGYSIGSTGALTALSSGNALFTDTVAAMTISPDGEYMYTVNSLGLTMAQYSLNTSTGALTSSGVVTVPAASCVLNTSLPVSQACSVAVSPAKNYVVASLGTAGDAVFGYATGSGVTNNGTFYEIAPFTNSGDFSVGIDASNNAYISQTAGMTAYSLGSTAATSRGTVSYASGAVPRSVAVDPESRFVFTANEGTGTISAFATGTSTALTAITGSPFTGPAHVSALGVDSTSSYLVALGYDSSAGVQLWSIPSSGVISQLKTAGSTTATQFPVLVAMSH